MAATGWRQSTQQPPANPQTHPNANKQEWSTFAHASRGETASRRGRLRDGKARDRRQAATCVPNPKVKSYLSVIGSTLFRSPPSRTTERTSRVAHAQLVIVSDLKLLMSLSINHFSTFSLLYTSWSRIIGRPRNTRISSVGKDRGVLLDETSHVRTKPSLRPWRQRASV